MEKIMDFKATMEVLQDIKDHPDILDELDSEMDKVLKEIIKIERRHLYGLNSTSVSKRREAIQELLEQKLKTKEG